MTWGNAATAASGLFGGLFGGGSKPATPASTTNVTVGNTGMDSQYFIPAPAIPQELLDYLNKTMPAMLPTNQAFQQQLQYQMQPLLAQGLKNTDVLASQLAGQLADRGMLDSSYGTGKVSGLYENLQDQLNTIAAQSQASQLKASQDWAKQLGMTQEQLMEWLYKTNAQRGFTAGTYEQQLEQAKKNALYQLIGGIGTSAASGLFKNSSNPLADAEKALGGIGTGKDGQLYQGGEVKTGDYSNAWPSYQQSLGNSPYTFNSNLGDSSNFSGLGFGENPVGMGDVTDLFSGFSL